MKLIYGKNDGNNAADRFRGKAQYQVSQLLSDSPIS